MVLAVVVAACTGSGEDVATEAADDVDRAGGRGLSEVTILDFAQINFVPFPILELWAEEVTKASNGTLQIEFHNQWHHGEVDFETKTITDVADGVIDAGWVGARAFDTVGVTSFQPLVAPLLVDSHELQTAVFEAGIADEMLEGLDALGVVGIGALPGPLFKILGKTHPYFTPDDFAGEVIGIVASEMHSQVFETLGATTELMPAGAEISGFDGSAHQLGSIWGNHYEFVADYVTANLNLWPRPLILFANAEVYESLDDTQRAALATASAAAVAASPAVLDIEESEGAVSLCDAGMQFPLANADELDELREALEPIYDQLASNEAARGFLDAVQAIKDNLGAAPHTVECAQAQDATEGSEIDGVYTMTLTYDDYSGSGCTGFGDRSPGDVDEFQLTLRSGDLEQFISVNGGGLEPAFIGYYNVFRDTFEFGDGPTPFTAHWSFDGRDLVLSDLTHPFDHDCVHAVVWTTHPWVRIDVEDEAAKTGPPEGTYSMTLTAQDLADSGCDSPNLVGLVADGEWYFETTLVGGRVEQWVWIGGLDGRREGGWFGTYEVFRDRMELTDTAGTMTARWSFQEGRLVFSDMQDVIGCDDIVVWATHPWTLGDSTETTP
jgi:TRAP-type C4-dicarboxylate transport system substrate-binding protein